MSVSKPKQAFYYGLELNIEDEDFFAFMYQEDPCGLPELFRSRIWMV